MLFRSTRHIQRSLAYALLFLFVLSTSFVNAIELKLENSTGNDKVLVCTGHGYQWINLAQLTVSSDLPPAHTDLTQSHCPLCLLSQDELDKTLYSPASFYGYNHYFIAKRNNTTYQVNRSLGLIDSPRHPRAPPF